MNLVIILGEILNIEYKIIDKGKVYAIAFSEIKIEMEKTKIKVIFKNDMADEIFRNKKMGDKILIKGRLQNTKNGLYIIAKNIEETNFNVKIKNKNGKMDKKSIR